VAAPGVAHALAEGAESLVGVDVLRLTWRHTRNTAPLMPSNLQPSTSMRMWVLRATRPP
jgi:hypothetical protein